MEELKARIRDIYVPVKRAKTLDPARVQALAEDILDHGLKAPICVRRDDARFVLVEGLHRLEACRALGDDTIAAIVVQARRS